MTSDTENELSNMTLVDDDDDEFEEEILVHVEFDCEVDHNMLNDASTFKLIGVDSDNPLMQLGSKVYQGEWRDVVGTSVFFEEDEEKRNQQQNVDPLFSKVQENPLKLACCTRKSLIMSRVFVKSKTDETIENSIPGAGTERSTNEINELTTTIQNQNEESIDSNKTVEQMAVT